MGVFYFILAWNHPPKDADHENEDPAIWPLPNSIYAQGHEIVLLPSYNVYLCNEAKWLRATCAEEGAWEGVCGGLIFIYTWSLQMALTGWEKAVMASDCTLGYAGLRGFSCGTRHVHQRYVPVDQQASGTRIWLLMVMIASAAYVVIGAEKLAKEVFERLESAYRDVSGVFTLVWQNFNLKTSKEREFYSSLLG